MPNNFLFVFAAYTLVWAVFFAYAFHLSRKAAALRAEIEALKRSLEGKDSPLSEAERR